jgi:hypothetical protein
MNKKAPVTVIIFNRPGTIDSVFKSIRFYKPEALFIIADGPREGNLVDQEGCSKARQLAEKNIDWKCKVYRNYSDSNLGLGQRMKSGLDWVFSMVDSSIILEDDCIPSTPFYSYCEELLKRYKDDTRIMHISGNNYTPELNPGYGSYFFSKYGHIWGWATWARAWKLMDFDMIHWKRIRERQVIRSIFNLSEYKFLEKIFDSYYADNKKPWGIRWFYSRMINNGLSIVPNSNLVTNIGIIGTHSEKKSSIHFIKADSAYMIASHPSFVIADSKYERFHFEKILHSRRSIVIRIIRKADRVLKSLSN